MSDNSTTAFPTQEVVLKVTDDFPTRRLARQRLIEARRERVAHYLMLGWTEARIAIELKVSQSLISYDVKAIREQWQSSTVDAVGQAALLDIARLDFIITGLLERAQFDYKAADACLKAIHQKAQILGYAQGVSFDVEQYIRELAIQNGYEPERALEIATRISVTLR
jgi:hypothetical protein